LRSFLGSSSSVLKLNSAGTIQWLKQIGQETDTASSGIVDASGSDGFVSIAIDKDDNLIAAGTTDGDFAETQGGNGDIMFVKLDTDGDIVWAKQIGDDTATSSALVVLTTSPEALVGVGVDVDRFFRANITVKFTKAMAATKMATLRSSNTTQTALSI
jgi:hypothetical protein